METKFYASLNGVFKERFYAFLRPFALNVALLQKTGNRGVISPERFDRICELTLPYSLFLDHTTLAFGHSRIEKAVEMAAMKGFTPIDYFFPAGQDSNRISIIVGRRDKNLYFELQEGLDGWTHKTAQRLLEFKQFLSMIFAGTFPSLPAISATHVKFFPASGSRVPEYTLLIATPGMPAPALIPIDDHVYKKSDIALGVETYGEFLEHHAFDIARIISEPSRRYPWTTHPASTELLFHTFQMDDILPLATGTILAGSAGRTREDRHEIKQFSARELAYGWFPEFIERIGLNAKHGLSVQTTVEKPDEENTKRGEK